MSNYSIDGDKVLCKGDQIASFDSATHSVISDKPLAPGIKGAINRLVETPVTFIVKGETAPSTPPPGDSGIQLDQASTPPMAPPAPPVPTEPAPIPSTLPEPAQDPRFGDKTPAYVEWYRKTKTPAEFQAKYGHRRIA